MAPENLYPGVYVEEVDTGLRLIEAVSTSVAAFVGRAPRGPTDQPVTIESWNEYQRRFGGLAVDCTMGYAVRGFYDNGGAHAVVVRVAPADAVAATIALALRSGDRTIHVVLEAAEAGAWGNRLLATAEPLDRVAPVDAQAFNLTVVLAADPAGADVVRERFVDVSLRRGHSRYLAKVLAAESTLVRVRGAPRPRSGTASPAAASGQGTGGSDGGPLTDAAVAGNPRRKTGLQALRNADLFNLLCIPPPVRGAATPTSLYVAGLALCRERRAFLIVDPDPAWAATAAEAVTRALRGREALAAAGLATPDAALYFPCVRQRDPLRGDAEDVFVPCGIVAGIIARTDVTRGVWKAPSGQEAVLIGARGLQVNLNDQQQADLNPNAVNCLRHFAVPGDVVWGARTLGGTDAMASEWKYIPVRRLALFIEESLDRGTQWVVFEPNGEPLWAKIRRAVGAFLLGLFRQGALQGRTPNEAYFVKCDATTTTPNDVDAGVVNLLVGVAPLKPVEFVIIQMKLRAGQVRV